MMLKRLTFIIFSVVLGGSFARADTTDAIGSATTVVNLVTAELAPDTRSLREGDGVHQNELIEVSPDGLGELVLVDDTKLALGPGSQLLLDKFVFDPNRTNGSIVLNLVKGAFRFVTGVASKPSYQINTPSASITVRGTVFDAFVHDDGAIWLLLHEGAIRVCNERNQCQLLDNPCNLVRVGREGDLGSPSKWASLTGGERDTVSFETAFPFVVTPPQVDPNPLFTRRLIEEGRCPDSASPPPREIDRTPPQPPTRKGKTYERRTKQTYVAPPRAKIVVVTPPKTRWRDKYPDKHDRGDKYDRRDNTAAKAVLGIGAAILIGKALSGRGKSPGSSTHYPGSTPGKGSSYGKYGKY